MAHVGPRLSGEATFAFHLRVLAHMLRAPPWARLPLTLRWLRADFRQELCPPPPPHVPLAFGPPPPRASAPRRRAADTESELEHDAETRCTLCARVLQVRLSTWSPGQGGLGFRGLKIKLFLEGLGSPLTPFGQSAPISKTGIIVLAAIPRHQYSPFRAFALSL